LETAHEIRGTPHVDIGPRVDISPAYVL
jgi:hypothetical protein